MSFLPLVLFFLLQTRGLAPEKCFWLMEGKREDERETHLKYFALLQELLLRFYLTCRLHFIYTYMFSVGGLDVKERWGRVKKKSPSSKDHCGKAIALMRFLGLRKNCWLKIYSQTNAFCWERSNKVVRDINFNYFTAPLLKGNIAHSFRFQQIADPHYKTSFKKKHCQRHNGPRVLTP